MVATWLNFSASANYFARGHVQLVSFSLMHYNSSAVHISFVYYKTYLNYKFQFKILFMLLILGPTMENVADKSGKPLGR